MFCYYVDLFIVKIYNQIEDAILRICLLDQAYKVPQDINSVQKSVFEFIASERVQVNFSTCRAMTALTFLLFKLNTLQTKIVKL